MFATENETHWVYLLLHTHAVEHTQCNELQLQHCIVGISCSPHVYMLMLFYHLSLSLHASHTKKKTFPFQPSFSGPYFAQTKAALLGIQALQPGLNVEVVEHPDRDTFRSWWFAQREVSFFFFFFCFFRKLFCLVVVTRRHAIQVHSHFKNKEYTFPFP